MDNEWPTTQGRRQGKGKKYMLFLGFNTFSYWLNPVRLLIWTMTLGDMFFFFDENS
jgi:hypothetical protein